MSGKFPKTINVMIDLNARSTEAENLLSYRQLETAMRGEERPSEVAEYQLVKVRKFRNQIIEVDPDRDNKHSK